MKHVVFFFYIIAFTTGCSSYVLALYHYYKYKTVTIRHFSWFILTLVFYSIYFINDFYPNIATDVDLNSIRIISEHMQSVFGLFFVTVAPYFFHSLLGIPFRKNEKIVFGSIDTLLAIAIIMFLYTPFERIGMAVIIPIFYGIILYQFIFIFAHLRKIVDRDLKRIIHWFIIISSIFLPFLLLDSVLYHPLGLDKIFPYGLFSVPVYLIALSVISIILSIKYLNHPGYLHDYQPTGYFREKFHITERESEIIGFLIRGFSNREISEKLFISFKTVENHIYNIYQKTGVKNRVGLLQFMLSHQAETPL